MSDPVTAGAAPGTKGPVLVAEDEPGVADVLALHLRAAGYDPVVAPDGLEALHALDRMMPVAIVLDLHLPRVSGFRLLEVLKQRPETAGVPVLVLTALSFAEARGVARAGIDDFLTKPFHPTEVVRRVERLCQGSSAAGDLGRLG
jgi:DNA-binding response OmpR family regulator